MRILPRRRRRALGPQLPTPTSDMSIDRAYRTRIIGRGNAELRQPSLVSKNVPAAVDLDKENGRNAELPEPGSGSAGHWAGTDGFPEPPTDLQTPQQPAFPRRIDSTPPDGGPAQSLTQAMSTFENAPAPFEKDFEESQAVGPMPKTFQEHTPANPPIQSVIEAHALADLVNQTKQFYQAFPMQNRSAAGHDPSELLPLIRQIRESFSEFVQAHVTRQELKDELTSLRLLIESKK